MAGRVLGPDGRRIDKPGQRLAPGTVLAVSEGRRFASRAGFKLEGALEDLGLNPAGLDCLDLGSSTGGFTDCLLQKGARRITAVDVGRGLMDARLASDPRVRLIEGRNARHLDRLPPEALGGPFDLAVMDLSFISLGLVLAQAASLLAPGGRILAMVKPQFEVGRPEVGKGGIVRDEALISRAVDGVAALAPALDPPLAEMGRAPSRLKGRDGNQEVFLMLG
jgi:23S rRNA (cytidine1920-2'-O)/16S rRNA (cytidine1409-2'-O)-methyltransferase